MAGPHSLADDSLARARNAFQRARLPRQPSDRELYHVAYAVDLAWNAPSRELMYGYKRLRLADTIRTQLEILPEMIASAEAHTVAARATGRRADVELLVAQLRNLLSAAEALTDVTAKTDVRQYFHDGAKLLATALYYVFHECGAKVSFTHEGSDGVKIIAELLHQPASQIVSAIGKWSTKTFPEVFAIRNQD